MFLGLCLTCAALLGWGIAAATAKPDRRFRELRRHPDRVTMSDVGHLLLSESVPRPTVDRVLGHARRRCFTARTMWRWAAAHGVPRLVTVLDAGLAEDTLLEHLDAGTAPDWRTLDVFAGLAADVLPAGMPIDELLDLDAVPRLEDLTFPGDLADWSTLAPDPLELRQFDDLPPIASFDGDDDRFEAA